MPTNPNMRGEKLRAVFEELGFKNVRTVIASGNVVFDSQTKSTASLEKKIETALQKNLGFRSTTMVRSHSDMRELERRNPFKGIKDEKPNYLVVTFFKDGREELPSVIDLKMATGTELMTRLEKRFGKEITTRTWKTVLRILAKMDSEK
jgi:uncharacterized protein (DUF1697 family)